MKGSKSSASWWINLVYHIDSPIEQVRIPYLQVKVIVYII